VGSAERVPDSVAPQGGSNSNFSIFVKGVPMRVVYLVLLLIVLAAVVVFAAQNNETVTLQFLDRSISCALSILIAVVYLLGMVSGWTVVGLLRRSLRGATVRRES